LRSSARGESTDPDKNDAPGPQCVEAGPEFGGGIDDSKCEPNGRSEGRIRAHISKAVWECTQKVLAQQSLFAFLKNWQRKTEEKSLTIRW
jgi:hypothetical protein